MLTIENIIKTYGALRAIDGISLSISPGRTTVLIGPSGCGKSTLLRVMVGLIRPDSGSVFFEDTPVGPETVESLRQRIGYVIQEGGLFPHLSAYDNAALMARFLGWHEDQIASRMEELQLLTQLPVEAMDRFPVQLSGGQRQRVSLMRALMLDPDVLLLDEPLGALDPMIRADLQADLKSIFQKLVKTVVMVTHDLSEAAYLGHEIVLLRDGVIVQQGSLEDLYDTPADPFVTKFVNVQRGPLEILNDHE
ncbi:MAG: ATP-binding cassette domain-containing protein [Candidatus Latescibacteria bacterium]|jgi:osmoprotectant transport system ATP-binding protein|nr:ATP-binding cassette domain-containing protein [Candidatus Latescibacterota bacterium]